MIGQALETCILEWGVDKIFTITLDNVAFNATIMVYLKKKIINWEVVLRVVSICMLDALHTL